VLWPLVERWRQEFRETGRLLLTEGRLTIPLESYVPWNRPGTFL